MLELKLNHVNKMDRLLDDETEIGNNRSRSTHTAV